MSERRDIVRLRLRTLYHDDNRLHQLRHMTGTGFGIPRILQRTLTGDPMYRVIQPGLDISYREPSIFSAPHPNVHTSLGQTYRTRWQITKIPEVTVPMTEISMPHYWALCREKRELEQKLHGYVRGHSFPLHVSPFGADRFRTFNPDPAFDQVCGFIRFAN